MRRLIEEAARAAPEECCGLLLGHRATVTAVVSTANVAADRQRRFEIDPAALVAAHKAARDGGPEVIGYYHSHPSGDGAPSATDRALACGDGRVWAIVAAGAVSFWRDAEAGFEALSTRMTQG